MIARAFVSANSHLVNSGLLPFEDTHLHIDAIACHSNCYRIDPEKQISVIHVKTADVHSFGIELQLPLDEFFVVDFALSNRKNSTQLLVGVDEVSTTEDIPEIVFRSFVNLEIDINGSVVVFINRILNNFGIAVSFCIVIINDVLLVSFIL